MSLLARFLCLSLVSFSCERSSPSPREEVMVLYEEVRSEFSDVPEISLDPKSWPSDSLVLLDVRPLEERAVSVIPGAISLEEVNRSLSPEKKYVAYCTIGARSARVVRDLRKKGIDAYNLRGSLLGWVHGGGEIVAPDGTPTKKVHVYGRRWNLLPPDYEGSW